MATFCRNYDAELYAFGQRLRENFEPEILKQALLDVSYLEKRKIEQEEVGIEPELNLEHNGEMANTGNRLMSLYVEQYLTTTIPKLPKKYIKWVLYFNKNFVFVVVDIFVFWLIEIHVRL